MVQRKFYRHTFQEKKGKRLPLKIFFGFLFCIIAVFLAAAFLFIFYAKDFPRPEKFTERPFIESSKIFDRSGKVILYEM